jgi:hypothetical protein
MRTLVLTAAVVLTMAAVPVLASFDIDQLTNHPGDCSAPNLASSDNGMTMVGYNADGYPILMSFATVRMVPTHSAPGEVWPDPVTLNSGGSPKVCWTREGFVAAFGSGGMILVYHSDLEGNWDLSNYELMDPGGEVMGIDLWGVPTDAAGPHVFMTLQVSTNPPYDDFKVVYAAGSGLGWTDFEVVAEEPTRMPHPQITYSFGPAGPWPTIFYLTSGAEEGNLVYTTKDLAGGWSTPVYVPGDGGSAPSPIEGFFDVVTHGPLNRSVFGLGPQPTCPCGTVHHLEYTQSAGWLPQENLTVDHNYMNWPKSPRVGADPEGRVHAFWYQKGSGMGLEPLSETLEYWVKDDAGWTEEGGFLDEQEGAPLEPYVGLDVSPNGDVVMAWSRRDTIDGVPQPEQVWIARPHDPADVPEPGVIAETVALSAWPNPFNPSVRLAMEVTHPGYTSLELFDLRGRRVVQLFAGHLHAGRREVDWDGRDAAGRPAASGVYFARLVTEDGRAVQKLVLAE